ncbi:MAG: PRC-barrel domain-containing protein [Leptonema sp. (in: Bacteria)]|nr:PRC-barrel domain-containing protein [Leptonema sp. (in: bacteria)]
MIDQFAIARVRDFFESESLFICTTHGSALFELECPFEAALFFRSTEPVSGSIEDLAPAFEGPTDDGRFQPVTVTQIRHRKTQVAIRVQLYQPLIRANVDGSWLCVNRKLLDSHNQLYFYKIKGLPVRNESGGKILAVITDYMETSANGIVIVRRSDNQELVYLPLHDDHVLIDEIKGECIVPNFDDFL